ncbi:MAG TPA: response regulator [Ramlibacter sp.]|jgi:two-component system response regulator DesR
MSTASATRAVKVFLADDSGPIRQRIAGMLSPASTIVGEGETPQGCIDGILATHPDVVVLDVQLVGGQGLEVLRAVRAADPRVAFVVFSNNSQAAYRKRYLAEGATRFLDKSTEFDQLAAAVDSAPVSVSH